MHRQTLLVLIFALAASPAHAIITPAPEMLAQLKSASSRAISEVTWHFAPARREGEASLPEETEIHRQFGPKTHALSSLPTAPGEPALHLDDLPPLLRRVLNAQLRRPGDVSAVIERPDAFALYLCRARDEHALSVVAMTVPKRSYEQWLETQSQPGSTNVVTGLISQTPAVPNQDRHPTTLPTP